MNDTPEAQEPSTEEPWTSGSGRSSCSYLWLLCRGAQLGAPKSVLTAWCWTVLLAVLLAFAIVVPALGLGLHDFLSIIWALFFCIPFFFFSPIPSLWASLVTQPVKNPPALRETWV